MLVYFFRHCERASGGDNPPLTPAGVLQAKKLAELTETEKLPKPHLLWTSPKRRAVDSLVPLATHLGLKVEALAELDERKPSESAPAFQQRVRGTLERIERLGRDLFLCSHLDWLEAAMSEIADEGRLHVTSFHWSAGGYIGFSVEDGHWHSQNQGEVPR